LTALSIWRTVVSSASTAALVASVSFAATRNMREDSSVFSAIALAANANWSATEATCAGLALEWPEVLWPAR
jgi:hypothetical protein